MSQHNFKRSCLINHSISEKDQQEEKSECVRENVDNQKTAQQKYCDNNQHKKDKKAAEAEQQLTNNSEQENTD